MHVSARLVTTAIVLISAVVVGGMTTASAAPAGHPSTAGARSASAATMAAPPTYQPDGADLYVPVTPCRVVYTGASAGGKMHNGTTRSFWVAGTYGFAPQGGKSGGCGIPVYATAVTAQLQAIHPNNPGNARAWAVGTSEPTAGSLVYQKRSIGNMITVPIKSGSGKDLRIRNYGGPTNFTVDVTGYYVKQIHVMVAPGGSAYSGTSRVLNVSKVGTGTYDVLIDRDPRYCSAQATVYSAGGFYANVYPYVGGNRVRVYLRDIDNHALVDANRYFYLTVTC